MPKALFLCGFLSLSGSIVLSTPQDARTLPLEDRPIAGGFEDLFTAGVATGADHEMLFGLVDIAFAGDGELYLLEERNHRVLVYGPDGSFRRRFGREGQGPGEFQLPMTLAVTTGGEIAVWDFQNTAYLLFAPSGDYLRQVRWDDWGTGPRRDTLRPWPEGGVVYLQQLLHEETDPPEDIDRGAILHEPLGRDGAPEELLAVHHPRRRSKSVGDSLILDSGPVFAPTTRWDVLSDGRLAVADGIDYRVRLVEPRAGETTVLERAIAPRPASDADREQVRERVRDAYENPAGAVSFGVDGGSAAPPGRRQPMSGRVRAIVDAVTFADTIPVIRDLRVDADDRLWIQRHGETFFDDGPIDIVSAAGAYLGTLPAMPMPDAFGPGGMVAWMERGNDVELERVIVRWLPASLRER